MLQLAVLLLAGLHLRGSLLRSMYLVHPGDCIQSYAASSAIFAASTLPPKRFLWEGISALWHYRQNCMKCVALPNILWMKIHAWCLQAVSAQDMPWLEIKRYLWEGIAQLTCIVWHGWYVRRSRWQVACFNKHSLGRLTITMIFQSQQTCRNWVKDCGFRSSPVSGCFHINADFGEFLPFSASGTDHRGWGGWLLKIGETWATRIY